MILSKMFPIWADRVYKATPIRVNPPKPGQTQGFSQSPSIASTQPNNQTNKPVVTIPQIPFQSQGTESKWRTPNAATPQKTPVRASSLPNRNVGMPPPVAPPKATSTAPSTSAPKIPSSVPKPPTTPKVPGF